MVRFLINTAVQPLLEVGAYPDVNVSGVALIRGWHLFETKRLLEEIQYLKRSIISG